MKHGNQERINGGRQEWEVDKVVSFEEQELWRVVLFPANCERLCLLPRDRHDEDMWPLPHMGRYKGKKVHLRKKLKGDQFGE